MNTVTNSGHFRYLTLRFTPDGAKSKTDKFSKTTNSYLLGKIE